MSNFNPQVIKNIAYCTEVNDHCLALIMASEMLGYTRLNKVFIGINAIADAEGGYDIKLMELRYSRYREMMNLAEDDLTGVQFQAFYGAF